MHIDLNFKHECSGVNYLYFDAFQKLRSGVYTLYIQIKMKVK